MPKQLHINTIMSMKVNWIILNNPKGSVGDKQTPIDTDHMFILK